MDYRSYQIRLNYVLELIEKNRFISVESAAKRFSVSTRTVKRMLDHLRDQGHDVQYDRKKKKYFIKKEE
jgi:predicted DNA-binding transcriptional regulator YafY